MKTDDLYAKGVAEFNSEDYFEAHETWEDLWNEASGLRRTFLKGLIQVAVGLCHAQRENFRGSHKLLGTAFHYLEEAKSESGNVDVDRLQDLMVEFDLAVKEKEGGTQESLPYFKLPLKDSNAR